MTLIRASRLQVHISVIHDLYIALWAQLPKSNQLLSPYIWSHFPLPTPLPSGNHHTVVCVYDFQFFLFLFLFFLWLSVLYPMYEWGCAVLSFFCLTWILNSSTALPGCEAAWAPAEPGRPACGHGRGDNKPRGLQDSACPAGSSGRHRSLHCTHPSSGRIYA